MSDILAQITAGMSAEQTRGENALHFGNWAAAATAAHPRQQHWRLQQQRQQEQFCCDHTLLALGHKNSTDVMFPTQQQQQQCWDDTMMTDQRYHNDQNLKSHTTQDLNTNSMSNSTAVTCSKRARTLLSPFMAAAAAVSSSMPCSPAAAAGQSAAAASSSMLEASGSLAGLRNRSITSKAHPASYLRDQQQQQQQQHQEQPAQLVNTDPAAAAAVMSPGCGAMVPAGASFHDNFTSGLFNSCVLDGPSTHCCQRQQQQQQQPATVPEPTTPCCSSLTTDIAAAAAAAAAPRISKSGFLSTLASLPTEQLQELAANIEEKVNSCQQSSSGSVTRQNNDITVKLRTLLRLKAQVCKEILARSTFPAAAAAAAPTEPASTQASLQQQQQQQFHFPSQQQSSLLQQLRQPRKLQLPQIPQPLQLLQQQQEQQQMLQQGVMSSMLAQQGCGGMVTTDTAAAAAAAAAAATFEQQCNEGATLDPAMAAALPVPEAAAAAAAAAVPKGSSSGSCKVNTLFADLFAPSTAAAAAAGSSLRLTSARSAPQVPGLLESEKKSDSLAIWGRYQGLSVTDIPPGWHNDVLQGLEEAVPSGLAAAADCAADVAEGPRPWASAPLVDEFGSVAQQQQQQQQSHGLALENANSRISCSSPLLISTAAAAAAASPSSYTYAAAACKLVMPAAAAAAAAGPRLVLAAPDMTSPTTSVSDLSQIPKSMSMAGDLNDLIAPAAAAAAAAAAVDGPDPFSGVDDFLEGLGSLEALAATPPQQGSEHGSVMALLNSSQGLPQPISPSYIPSSSPEVLCWHQQQQQQRSNSSSSGLVLPECLSADGAFGASAAAAAAAAASLTGTAAAAAAAKPPLAPVYQLDRQHSWQQQQQQQAGFLDSDVDSSRMPKPKLLSTQHTRRARRKQPGSSSSSLPSPDIWERSRCISDSGFKLPAPATAATAGQNDDLGTAAQAWQQQQSSPAVPAWLQLQNTSQSDQLQQEMPLFSTDLLSQQQQQQQQQLSPLSRHWSAPIDWCQFDAAAAAAAPATRTMSSLPHPFKLGSSSSKRRRDNGPQQLDQQQQQQWSQFFSNSKLPPVGSIKYQRLQQVWVVIKARNLVWQLPPEAVAIMTQLELDTSAATSAAAVPADPWQQQQQQQDLGFQQQCMNLQLSTAVTPATTSSSASLLSQQQQQQQEVGDQFVLTISSVPTPELSPNPAAAAAAGSGADEVFRSVSGELAAAISHLRTYSVTHSQGTAAAAADHVGGFQLAGPTCSTHNVAGPAAATPAAACLAGVATTSTSSTAAAVKSSDNDASPFGGAFSAAAVAAAVEGDLASLDGNAMAADKDVCDDGWLDEYQFDLDMPQRSLPMLQLSDSTEVALAGLL